MSGTRYAEIEISAEIEQLPPEARLLLDAGTSIFMSRSWWDVVLSHAMGPGADARFVAVRLAGKIAALMPMVQTRGKLASLTTPYSCEYAPLLAAGLNQPDRVAIMAAFARWCRSSGVVRLDALPTEWDGLTNLRAGARQAHLQVLQFNHFGNWHEDVGGLDWSAYLLRRPGALRETVRRRLRRADKLPGARFDLFTDPAHMDRAAEAFEWVYRRSWKDAEPYPTFNVALMRAMSALGLLRFGVWSIDTDPVAVQMWVVSSGHAVVLKLAHDETYKAHSPGTVLTALMLRHLLDKEKITQIDFGRGDDAYKQGWAALRRQRIGLLLVNPWSASGSATLLRHALGRIRTMIARQVTSSPLLPGSRVELPAIDLSGHQ